MNWKFSESFAGIGAWGKAIERVTKRHGDTCELQWYAEIDKYASNAFAAIHEVSEDLNIWDITTDQEVKPMDIFFYSPPCQTFSIAGKRELTSVPKGNLFYDAVKFVKQNKPKYAIMENVRGLPSGDSKKDFNNMLWYLEKIGYVNYWKILNSKDYGIPQNRERVFIVSIRKDLYNQGKRFEFPQKMELKFKLKDFLEKRIDPKYYISDDMLLKFIELDSEREFGFINQNTQASKIYKVDTFSQTLTAGTHGYAMGYIAEGFYGADYRYDEGLRIRKNGLSPCLKANLYKSTNENDLSNPIFVIEVNGAYFRIRKLTPLECFRLQGFDDEDYYKAVESYDKTFTKGKSDTQMYMRAGNSITVNVIEEILENLLYDRKQEGQQLSLF